MDEISLLIDGLFSAGESLSPRLCKQILDCGAAAAPLLIGIVDDDLLYAEDARGQGYAPLHAIEILGELQSAAAIPSLLRVLRSSDSLDMARGQAMHALKAMGAMVLEACLAAFIAHDNEDLRMDLAYILAGLGVSDERIFQQFLELLPLDRTAGSSSLAEYGDPRALPHLAQALDEYQLVSADSPFANHDVIELCAAIEDLGGELTAEQSEKLRRARAPSERFRRTMDALMEEGSEEPPARRAPIRASPRPGRNQPCHCGSGKKYKKCHLHEDEKPAVADVSSP